MSDVVIIYPKTGFDTKGVTVTLPLSILGAASGLVKDYSVKLIDQRTQDDWKAVLKREITEKNAKVVAVSSMTGTQIYFALEITIAAKEIDPDIPVIWGGMHATLMAEQTLRHPKIDFVMKGEAELSFPAFMRELTGARSYQSVGGLCWKEKDGTIRINADGPTPDINALPDLPYEGLNIEDYTQPTEYLFGGISRLLPYQGSRGCPYKCTFCSEPVLTKVYRMVKAERFYEQTMKLKERFNLDHIPFYDEEFFVNVRWANRIAEMVNGQYTWIAQTRADDLLRIDLDKMEKCGLRVVWPGLESGSNRVLEFIKKRQTVNQYLEANRKLAATNIVPKYNFIIGYPGETLEELNATVDLTLQLLKDNPKAVVNSFSPFTPLPGTELLDISVKEYGFKPPQTLEEWVGISRRQLPAPWMREKGKLEMHKNLMYTSVFLNTAKRFAQDYWWAPQFAFDWYSKLIEHRWKKHTYERTVDIRLMEMLHRYYSPVDFLSSSTKSC